MLIDKEQIFKNLSDSVVNMEEEETSMLANKVVEEKIDAYEAIEKGLSDGMNRAGKLFEEEEYFVPELLMCSDAMYAGLNILKPYLKKAENENKYKVVIGVVEGDTHDIGKNLVKLMLETAGFEIIDLGRDVPAQKFIDEAKDAGADIIAISSLMTTTMDTMEEVIKILKKDNMRHKFKVMVGGGPVSQNFADKIGADGYSINASEAVRLAKRLVGAEIIKEVIA
ncbi:corrinoid protein [Clostridium sp. WILCCON 0269]|uniref:Corrinoid protein n=1 Tax=Candidatus Clostridium eludens TaxID=3381663 RepID=A0ABW8SFR5_9CLOT